MLQNATPLRISDEHVSCTVPAPENASCQTLVKCPTPAIVFGNATKPSPFAHFWQGAQSLAPAPRNDIWTSKSAPSMVCFVHFDLETCFAPQQRALFRHLNFQKCSEADVFCTFWLRNVLRTATARNFSPLISPDGSAPAALARLLFDPPKPQIIGKTQCWLCYLFAHLHLLSSRSFSSLIFSLLLFSSRTLPTSAFLSVHIVGSLTSKLPSILGSESVYVVILVVVRISWVFPKRSIRQNGRTGL